MLAHLQIRTLLVIVAVALAAMWPACLAETFTEALSRGVAAEERGDDESAVSAFSLAKNLAPPGVNDARLALARLYRKLARFQEAESEYQTMLGLSQSRALKMEIAEFHVEQGKFRTAMSMFQELAVHNPNDTRALLNLGVCLESTDNLSSAKDYYQRVIELAPGSGEAAKAKRQLARLDKAIDAQQSGQYFPLDPEFGLEGLGWWNLKKMPIHVYIDEGNGVKGYRPSMRSHVLNAMSAWSHASGRAIQFVVDPSDPHGEAAWKEALGSTPVLTRIGNDPSDMPSDPIKTGIHVHWTDDLSGIAAGLAWTNVFGNRGKSVRSAEITHGHVWLNTDILSGGRHLPEQETVANTALFQAQDRLLAEVAIHEFGHILGLLHSSNPTDIMCSGVFALNSKDSIDTRSLSSGDIASLAQHYNNFKGTGMLASTVKLKTDSAGNTIVHGVEEVPRGVKLAEAGGESPAAWRSMPMKDSHYLDALFDINTKRYGAGAAKLTRILEERPDDATALYLRAVAGVMLHNFAEAARDYRKVIQLAPGSDLAARAQDGLKKLGR